MNKGESFATAKNVVNRIDWFVPQFTLNIEQQASVSKTFLNKRPTEHGSVFMNDVNNENVGTFELGSYGRINVSIWINVGFYQRDWENSKTVNTDTFSRLPGTDV